jgi:hypothetical protein
MKKLVIAAAVATLICTSAMAQSSQGQAVGQAGVNGELECRAAPC